MYKQDMDLLFKRSRELAIESPLQSFDYDVHKSAIEIYSGLPKWEKMARSVAYAITKQKIYIEPQDRIIGRTYFYNAKPVEKFDPDFDVEANRSKMLEEHPEYSELCDYFITGWGFPGHIAWNWNLILTKGTVGIRELCYRGISRYKEDKTAQEFFNGVIIMLDALDEWNDMHVQVLESMGKKEEAEICKRVPKYPARNFREAVQSFFMQYIIVIKENPYGGNSPGRLDYYLWPYLEKDLKDSNITEEEAQELIEELFIRLDERIYRYDTWGESIVVGGTHSNGQTAVNLLSYMMIKAYMKYDIVHPYVYASISENTPKDFVELCSNYVMNGKNRAQIINDEAIVSALVKAGVSVDDAHRYFCGGCMEIAVQGTTSDLLFTARHSIAQILEFCITGGYSIVNKKQLQYFPTRSLVDFSSFEDFYNYFVAQCKRTLDLHLKYMDLYSECSETSRPIFLISSMIDGCLEKGRNMHGGGAKHHDYGASLMGLPNAADSLTAIKKAVFDDKLCTAVQLIQALKVNFIGYELLYKKLLEIPKYGQENEEADLMMTRLTTDVCNNYMAYKNRFGGYGKPVILSFLFAPSIGAILGATPDGRKCGTPVAQAVTPQSMSMTKGITAAMNSCTKLSFDLFPGGATTMWDLDSSWANEQIVEWLIRSFFKQGGQFFQGNVTDVNELIRAQECPENYPHLIVRIGGYSGRFISLNREVQNEIINRTRHSG